MIFLTVGTQFPFDRLVKAVDRFAETGNIGDEIYAQIGNSSYRPCNFQAVGKMDIQLFEQYVRDCTAIIGHSGMGTITMALKNNKPLLVMPRLKEYEEAVNNHQIAIARQFELDGHLLAAYTENEIGYKIIELKTFIPRKRLNTRGAVVDRISHFLDAIV